MTVCEMIDILNRAPQNATVVVIEGDDFENKRTVVSPYVSSDGELVIQFWN